MNLRANQLTSLSRPLDFSYPSNRFAIAAGIISFLIWIGVGAVRLNDPDILEVLWYAINLGGAAFLAWTIARELDPDYAGAAMIAAIVSPILVIALEQIPQLEGLIAGALLMQTARFLSRSTGIKLYLTDALLIIAEAAIVAASDLWLVGIAVALAFWADGVLTNPNERSRIYAAITLVLVLIIAAITDQFHFEGGFLDEELAVALTIALVAFWVIPKIPDPLVSKTDYTNESLLKSRVAYSINVVLITLIAICLATTNAALKLIPLWASLIGMIAIRVYKMVQS